MKKRTKERLVGLSIGIIIVILAMVTTYFLDINKNNDQGFINNNISDTNVTLNSEIFSDLEVHFIDVGQADAILIEQENHYMLIDAGKNDTSDNLINYLKDQGIKKFDYVVGTHSHEDHIGGMAKVVKEFEIDQIMFPKQTATTKTFRNFVAEVQIKNKKLLAPAVGEKFTLGEASFEIMAPYSASYKDTNDYSIVVKLSHGQNTFLFTGDAQKISEQEMIDQNLDLKSDVLKIGHHGSKSSTISEFLERVSPSTAVISVGKDNTYGHPTKDVMLRLQLKNIPVYRTDESGTIIASSDGNNIKFNASPGTYNYGE